MGLSLNFQNVPYSRWLTKINSSCLMLNCHVLGPPGWEISYQIRHKAYSCARHPEITPDRKGSLIICNMDENRHHGQYRCEASNSQGSRAYKEITVTRSAIRRFRSGLLEQYTGLVEPISCRREPAPFIEITDLRTLNRQQRGQRYQYCIEVRCTATGHPEPLSYRFRYKEIPVPSPFLHRGITVSGNVLTHCNTSLANLGGSYTCTASNSLPRSVSKSIDVTVAAPVENFVRVVHFTRTSSPQGCTTFNCQVDGAPQPLTYRMTYNRGSLPPGFTSLSQTSFRYCGPSLPGGTYRCSASNRHGSRAFKDITIRKDTYNYELLLAFATKRPGSLLVDCSGDG
ncbi:intercellular adhesion molecule 5-like isoform X1 [Sycon ciliatum]|uniref:intercellular adhesion molecule 5-like isoform X1 n=2 Tax=Sycon ciliatum TaxID=27933 RepID=UPI0031F7170F